jgi:hypothetical protein
MAIKVPESRGMRRNFWPLPIVDDGLIPVGLEIPYLEIAEFVFS